MGFVSHSYTWWFKANDPVINAGIIGTVVFSAASIGAVAFALWAHGRLYEQRSRLKYVAQLLGLAGLSGLLVFFGMVSVGYVLLVHR
jgi:cbb3-type cytochrome oxidase subunit 3